MGDATIEVLTILCCRTGDPNVSTCWLALFCMEDIELLEDPVGTICEPEGTIGDPEGTMCGPEDTNGDPEGTIDEREDAAGETADHEEGGWSWA